MRRVSFGHVDDQTGRRRGRFPGDAQPRGVGRGQAEVARPRGEEHRPVRGRQHAQVIDEPGARLALGELCRGCGGFGSIGLAIDERDEGRQVVGFVPHAVVSHGTAPSGPRAGRGARAGRDGCAT